MSYKAKLNINNNCNKQAQKSRRFINSRTFKVKKEWKNPIISLININIPNKTRIISRR